MILKCTIYKQSFFSNCTVVNKSHLPLHNFVSVAQTSLSTLKILRQSCMLVSISKQTQSVRTRRSRFFHTVVPESRVLDVCNTIVSIVCVFLFCECISAHFPKLFVKCIVSNAPNRVAECENPFLEVPCHPANRVLSVLKTNNIQTPHQCMAKHVIGLRNYTLLLADLLTKMAHFGYTQGYHTSHF